MIKKIAFCISFFFCLMLNAQIEERTESKNNSSQIPVKTNQLDTIPLFDFINHLKSKGLTIKKHKFHSQIDSVYLDSLKKIDLITIKKSLLDSLLKPYYNVKIDTALNDTLYEPKYRMVVKETTHDTSFVSIPKVAKFIPVDHTYRIEPIVFSNKIKPVEIEIKEVKEPEWWEYKNSISLDLNEVAFVNWNSGGENAISGLLKLYLGRTYEDLHTLWKSEVYARYGLINQQNKGLRKTDDELKMSSSFGYRKDTLSNWYTTAVFNFNTQFTNGYSYPNTDKPISKFFAPAYLFLGVGSEYNLKKEHLSVYLSPVTFKSTFVWDEALSDDGAFGVDPGKRSRIEFGSAIRAKWQKEIFKNIALNTRLNLYTDYLNNFGNIDVDWYLNFKFKINKYFEANLGAQLIYDDDIKYKEDTNGDGQLETFGPKVQLKQNLSIGVIYKF